MNNQHAQNGQPARHPIDKGFIKVVIGQYPKKVNGQPVYKNGTNEQVLSNKYHVIGEVTRWPSDDGTGCYDAVELYPGVTILDSNKNGRIFWNSQGQQNQTQSQPQNTQAHGHQVQTQHSQSHLQNQPHMQYPTRN